MIPNTDRLIVSNIEEIKKPQGMFSNNKEDVVEFRTAIVEYIGVKPDGSLPTDIQKGDKILMDGSVLPRKLPVGEDLHILRRTSYELIIK